MALRSTWYNASDFTQMAAYGLNTVRIPLGFWTVDALIGTDEHYPTGSWSYVRQVCAWAKAVSDSVGSPASGLDAGFLE